MRNQARREGRLLTRPRQAPCPYHEEVTHDGRNWSPRAELTAPVVDRHAAINRVVDAIASGALGDAQVMEVLATVERLRGAA